MPTAILTLDTEGMLLSAKIGLTKIGDIVIFHNFVYLNIPPPFILPLFSSIGNITDPSASLSWLILLPLIFYSPPPKERNKHETVSDFANKP